jgi:hypothetical protein
MPGETTLAQVGKIAKLVGILLENMPSVDRHGVALCCMFVSITQELVASVLIMTNISNGLFLLPYPPTCEDEGLIP